MLVLQDFGKKYPANFTMGAFSSYLGPTIGTPFSTNRSVR